MSFTDKASRARIVCLFILSLLAVGYLVKHSLTGKHVGFRLFVSLVPLLIFVPGLLARKYRSASLLCFVLLLHFMTSVMSLFHPDNQLIDAFIMGLILGLFTCAMFYSRWQQRADRLELPINGHDSHAADMSTHTANQPEFTESPGESTP